MTTEEQWYTTKVIEEGYHDLIKIKDNDGLPKYLLQARNSLRIHSYGNPFIFYINKEDLSIIVKKELAAYKKDDEQYYNIILKEIVTPLFEEVNEPLFNKHARRHLVVRIV